jgi:hypothetical protein
MSRQVETSEPVQDNFSAFENDGYTKRSGLTAPDFTVTVYKDGAPLALSVTITEIGSTGEYMVELTPAVDGFYSVQILIDFSKEIWEGEYTAGETSDTLADFIAIVKSQCDKIDLVPTLGPAAVTSGSLMDRSMNKNASKTYNQSTDSLEAIRDRSG